MPYPAQPGPLGDDQAEQFIPLLEGAIKMVPESPSPSLVRIWVAASR